MTLNQFLDVAYALLVEELRRLGTPLTDALERTREYAAGGHRQSEVTASGKTQIVQPQQPTLTAEELQNEASLTMLEQALSGVGGVR